MDHLGKLPFEFRGGTCSTFMTENSPIILLCFAMNDTKRCRSLIRLKNGGQNSIFEFDEVTIPKSKHDHMFTTIANYKGFPLILGSFKNKKLEMLDISNNKWSENKHADYPNSKA